MNKNKKPTLKENPLSTCIQLHTAQDSRFYQLISTVNSIELAEILDVPSVELVVEVTHIHQLHSLLFCSLQKYSINVKGIRCHST